MGFSKEFLTCLEIAGVGASMKLILKSGLDCCFHVLRDVASVRDIPDPGEWHWGGKWISKRWQIFLKASNDEGVSIWCEVIIEGLVKFKRNVRMIARTIVATILTFNLTAVYKVDIGIE